MERKEKKRQVASCIFYSVYYSSFCFPHRSLLLTNLSGNRNKLKSMDLWALYLLKDLESDIAACAVLPCQPSRWWRPLSSIRKGRLRIERTHTKEASYGQAPTFQKPLLQQPKAWWMFEMSCTLHLHNIRKRHIFYLCTIRWCAESIRMTVDERLFSQLTFHLLNPQKNEKC